MFSLWALSMFNGSALSFETQKVKLTRLGDTLELTAFFSKPDGEPPFPALVFLHGCSGIGLSGSLSATYSTWMRLLAEKGFAVLAIDSATPRGFGSTCGRPERKTMYFERPGDAYSGLAYLQSREDISADQVGLVGWSQGGGIALLTIVTKSIGRPVPPPSDDFKAAVAFYPSACSDRHQSKPFTEVEPNSWSTVAPLLILHGGKDNWTPVKPCVDFVDAARDRDEPVEIIAYPEAAHSFDAPNLPLRRRSFPRLRDGSFPLIGTNQAARADAIMRVSEFLERRLTQ